jgi:hypothetical protein
LSATLVLGREMEGRFFVRNAAQELIVEVYKPYGRTISLGVEPGAYEVRVEHEKTALLAKVSVADGGQLVVDRKQFNPTAVEPTRSRGPADTQPFAVRGRNRFEVRLGMWNGGSSNTAVSGISTGNVFGGIQYTRYLEENLAITFAIEGVEESGVISGSQGAFSGLSSIATFPIGVRWNPLKFGRQHDGIKPFLSVGAGPAIGESLGSYSSRYGGWSGNQSSATAFGYLRGGADLHFARNFAIGVDAGYNWVGDFGQSAPVDHSGFSMGLGIGWLFGKGSPRP